MIDSARTPEPNPLGSLDEWDDDVKRRYPEPAADGSPSAPAAKPFVATNPDKKKEEFRDYRAEARASVKEFYRLNHTYQTYDFVQQKRAEFLPRTHARMGVWEALEFLNTLVDDSDPDTDVPQIEHCLQTAEAIRRDGHPRWFILTGLIHDLGKILCLRGEPQWCVVGDTFPVGCRFSESIVFPEFFSENPDSRDSRYQTECGVYERNCGLDRVTMSWGHDEYLYHVVKDYLPEPALYMIRYHSFYPGHRERAYDHLMSEHDQKLFAAVRAFNPYDLYTKSEERPNVAALRPFYEALIAEYFPPQLAW
ncbi:MAG: inositol oxygenase [Pirellulales bacterium]|nr:inositol oxygenase [Pirellulales bacterium]